MSATRFARSSCVTHHPFLKEILLDERARRNLTLRLLSFRRGVNDAVRSAAGYGATRSQPARRPRFPPAHPGRLERWAVVTSVLLPAHGVNGADPAPAAPR